MLFAVEGDQAILRPLKKKPLRELYGALPATRPYPGLEAVRRKVRRKRAQRFEKGNHRAHSREPRFIEALPCTMGKISTSPMPWWRPLLGKRVLHSSIPLTATLTESPVSPG